MKVIIPNPKNKELVEIEAKITKKIVDADIKDMSHCIKIFDSFSFFKNGVEYFALVIELLGLSLYDYLKNNDKAKVSLIKYLKVLPFSIRIK